MNMKKIVFLGLIAIFALVLAIETAPTFAAQNQQATPTTGTSTKMLGAGLAVGLAGVGGGVAVGIAGASAISAVAEKSEMSGYALLIVALGEGIAIYGFVISLLIMFVGK
ncbi:MAG: ATP synthase subunit C [Desulfurococcales archaeon]|nr:ATP synthase subunit C [Desulfurococcales archaeon]